MNIKKIILTTAILTSITKCLMRGLKIRPCSQEREAMINAKD